jgi:rod shape-determining protein MreD
MAAVRRWLLALFLLIALVLEGSLAKFLHPVLWQGASFYLTLIGLGVAGLNQPRDQSVLWLAGVLGFLSDSYYLGVIGVSLVSFPLLVLLAQRTARVLPEVTWVKMLFLLALYLLQYIYASLIMRALGLVAISGHSFLLGLFANVASGVLWILVTFWLWQFLCQKFPFLSRADGLY